ncbi:MAG: hypothetical protein PSV13_10220 [Lacunisphaera sp.]|nr:hypothetical protein [Lacunisphaera sp.]
MPPPDRIAGTAEAVRHYFASRAEVKRRELRQLLRQGRASLLIGLLFLAVCIGLGALVPRIGLGPWSKFLELGLDIVGWVAMWRPLEIFLYEWWPIMGDRRLMQRLARMKVGLVLPET